MTDAEPGAGESAGPGADDSQVGSQAGDADGLAQAAYPIEDFAQLLAVLGHDRLLLVRGAEVPASDAGQLIPPYYFPISNSADFRSKLADLAELAPLTEQDLHDEWAQREAGLAQAAADCWS